MDITLLEQQGISAWEPEGILYEDNSRNSFRYYIKFIKMIFDFEARCMTGSFRVIRYSLQSNEWKEDLSYVYDSKADETTIVDKDGNMVPENDPAAWGDEFKRMRVLFNAAIKDSEVVVGYQQELFNRGTFDKPKIASI